MSGGNPRSKRTRSTALAVAALVCAIALPAVASDAPAWGHRIANELMSPFCPGVTLAECPSPQAGSLKMWILVQASAGRGEAEVREELYERYGDQIRPTPKAEGMGLAAYVIPAAAFLAGGGFVAWFLRRSTRGSGTREAAPRVDLDPEVERKLDDLLAGDDDGVDER